MIYIALGANLLSPRFGAPRTTLLAAVEEIGRGGIRVAKCSRWYRSPAYPRSEQPDFVNGVISAETTLQPAALMARLHAIETSFGRVRGVPNEARTLDLDLIAYHGEISNGRGGGPVLPHPRVAERAFVLRPLQELDPDWRHPLTGTPISALIAALPSDQWAEPIEED